MSPIMIIGLLLILLITVIVYDQITFKRKQDKMAAQRKELLANEWDEKYKNTPRWKARNPYRK